MANDRDRDDWRGDRSGGRGRGSSIFSDEDDNRWRGERGAYGGGGRDWNPEEKGWGRSSGPSEGGGGRGFFERARDHVHSWFGDDDDRGSSYGRGSAERSRFGQGQSGFGGESYQSNQSGNFGGREERGGFGGYGGSSGQPRQSHFDENYRRWRDQQIARLDQEYEDYCRERQQRFEGDFDTWRQSRQGGADQSFGGQSGDFTGQSGDSERTGGDASTRRALLGEESAGAATTGGSEPSTMESSTGSSPETAGEGRGRG